MIISVEKTRILESPALVKTFHSNNNMIFYLNSSYDVVKITIQIFVLDSGSLLNYKIKTIE